MFNVVRYNKYKTKYSICIKCSCKRIRQTVLTMLWDGLTKVNLKEIPKVTYQSLWCGCGSLVDV